MSLSTPALIAFLVCYVIFCGMVMYFCVIADPSTSQMAHVFQVRLPNKMWSMMGSILSDKQMDSLQSILDLGLVLVYFFVVLGCWTIVFWYIYPWIDRSVGVGNYHKNVGYVLFLACFGSWRLANKSLPGIITPKSFQRFDHYPYDNLMFVPNKRCETTKQIRIPRSKFDRLKYHQNVPRYDHFCGWVYNTIGEENYRWFLLFLLIHVVMCLYGCSVCALLFYSEIKEKQLLEITFFDRASGEHVRSNLFIVTQYLFARNTLEFAVFAIMFVMGIALGAFLGYHVSIISWILSDNHYFCQESLRSSTS
jgi:palmitoyltransferase